MSNDQTYWPTEMRSRLADGRMIGVDNSVWLYRAVPLSPVRDAKTPAESIAAAGPLLSMFEELAAMTPVRMARRRVAKSDYRQVHMMLVNVPRLFSPDEGHPIAEHLREVFPDMPTDRRLLLFGVRLRDKLGSGGFKDALESVRETILSGGVPLADYDEDFARVREAMDRCGLYTPSSDDLSLANAWWNHGKAPDTPVLPHADHLHIFTELDAMAKVEAIGLDRCDAWDDEANRGQYALSFAAAEDVDLDFITAEDPRAHWVSGLMDAAAVMVSIRGQVEPATVTRGELRRQRKRYMDDINERFKHGKMERAEQQEMESILRQVEGLYAKSGPPSLVGASIITAFSGRVHDVSQVAPNSMAKLNLMAFRQQNALTESMLCSGVRANPYLHDMPSYTIACSGIQSIARVGDKTGALLGFTERDRQPTYVSPTAASSADTLPLMLVAGATGSGKTMTMLHLSDQFTRMGNPCIIIDPKQGSDLSDSVLNAGGQVSSLDDLMGADGIFDPIRFSANAQTGVELAASVLMSINPWGTYKSDYETPLMKALAYGVSRMEPGERCTIGALKIARDEAGAPADMVKAVIDLAEASSMFAACAGTHPTTEGLRITQKLTLIKVGSAHLDLPSPGTAPESLAQRIAMALVRMMVFGSAMAMSYREGVVMLDEAWVFMGAGRAEVERLGRLARSQRVLPVLYTQRVSDATLAGLSGYISRGLIGPIEDEEEARAACELFKLEPTPERIGRITAKAQMGSNDGNTAPNWNSMRSLKDPDTGEVLRGVIAIYADLAGRAIPVEITLPKHVLELGSTSPDDVRRREAAKAAAEAAAQAAAVSGFLADPLDAVTPGFAEVPPPPPGEAFGGYAPSPIDVPPPPMPGRAAAVGAADLLG